MFHGAKFFFIKDLGSIVLHISIYIFIDICSDYARMFHTHYAGMFHTNYAGIINQKSNAGYSAQQNDAKVDEVIINLSICICTH